jgi:hypothetical protein
MGDDTFVFALPVWTIAIEDLKKQQGLPAAYSVMEAPGYGPLLVFFTDEALAVRFIEESGLAGRVLVKLTEEQHLLAAIRHFERIGVTHVGIDCPTRANPRGETGRYPTVRQIVAALKRQ